jgi:hypothetical protein
VSRRDGDSGTFDERVSISTGRPLATAGSFRPMNQDGGLHDDGLQDDAARGAGPATTVHVSLPCESGWSMRRHQHASPRHWRPGEGGGATAAALIHAGHDVVCTDIMRGVFERPAPGEPAYYQADLTNPGDAYAVVRGMNAVVHAAAIPDPTHNPPATVFQNNLMATFNILEAAVRWKVSRFVNISSETVPGFFFPERPFLPDYVPVDEEHPIRPQDPYALSKYFGEL